MCWLFANKVLKSGQKKFKLDISKGHHAWDNSCFGPIWFFLNADRPESVEFDLLMAQLVHLIWKKRFAWLAS